jgi:cellulose synthase/poly-beta-1,6-N-acetylglucosamine synthase-like glycosyltransferase
MMETLFWLSAGVLFYVYAGYPLLLWLIVRLRGARTVRIGAAEPPVTLVISAYNEAAVIRQKLENVLALDYPPHLLEIVVVSDASSDGTDDIVREYAERGVRLARQEERRGKTAGLNQVVPHVAGEVVVFSDANAMYAPEALRMLVRNFADPAVGCVTGEARYVEGSQTAADAGERAYWSYEIQVKRLETAVGSMVGGDGAIYAIRRHLWGTLPENAINDFLNPLQIVAAGWRVVYEPLAVCFEETAGGVRTEYRRRVRIVSRSWRALFQAPGVLNPFKVGFFAVSVVSHKVLRWFTGVFAAALVVSFAALMWFETPVRPRVAAVVGGAALVALLCPPVRRLVKFGGYFAVITLASAVGLLKGSVGRVSGTWTTPRAGQGTQVPTFAPGLAVLAMGAALVVGFALVAVRLDVLTAVAVLFWVSAAFLFHVYVGYPLAVALWAKRFPRLVRQIPIEPSVCLFVTANDEAAVIEAKIRNCLALDYPRDRLEILVASDGSVDGTNEIVRAFAPHGVRLLAFPTRRGKIAAINDGMTGVGAEIVVFSDANTFLHPGAIRALVRNFADETVGAVSGDVVLEGERAALANSEDLYYRYERWLQACESRISTMVGVDGALYAIRRELFVPPPVDTILDDMAIPMAVTRAGRRVVFEPEAHAHERGSESATEEFVRKARVVAGAVQFLGRSDSAVPRSNRQLIFTMVSHKALRWLSPILALAVLVTSAVLAWYSTWFLVIAIGQLLFIAGGLAGCVPKLRRLMPISIAHYFWLVQAAAAVGFTRGLLGQQSVAWRRFQRAPVEVA